MSEQGTKPTASASANPALFLCMTGMVLANLLFVHLTKAAESSWLLVLAALTLAAPWLARFKEQLWYRGLWNIALIAFFGLLLQHATSKNLEFVLQDGLVLAVLCQVHLLNNLRSEQRPDLLFLNSFLIAVITGYITVDMGFAAAFLLYAPFFLFGLQFLSVARLEQKLSPGAIRAIVKDGIGRSAVVLGLTFAVFLFWPRDFERVPMLADYFDLDAPSESHEIGFSNSMELKKRRRAETKPRPVLVIAPSTGRPEDVPELWRGGTLPTQSTTDTWKPLPPRARLGKAERDPRWRRRQGRLSLRRYSEPKGNVSLRVTRLDGTIRNLFLPRSTQSIELDSMHTQGRLVAVPDGTVKYTKPGQLHYKLTLQPNAPDGKEASEPQHLPAEDSPFLRVSRAASNRAAAQLAQKLRRKLPDDAAQAEVVRYFANYLRTNYEYRDVGDPDAAGSLTEFLEGSPGGHCEFFASALTTMLRSVEIPSRVTTGFRSDRWDEEQNARVVLNIDAHAWVEVLDPFRGWYAVDATPASSRYDSGPGLLAKAQQSLGAFWRRITGFDGEKRTAVMEWIQAAPGRVWSTAKGSPLGALAIIGAAVGLLFGLRWRKKRRVPVTIRTLERACEKAGVPFHASHTPRELLELVDPVQTSQAAQDALVQAVEQHESARYSV